MLVRRFLSLCRPHKDSNSVNAILFVPGRAGPGDPVRLRAGLILVVTLASLVAGCANFIPRPGQGAGFMQRAQTQTKDAVTVTVAVPSAEEAAAIFGAPLNKREIQPVWVRVDNKDDVDYVFLAADMDPDYFSPQEVAWMFRSRFSSQGERAMQLYLDEQAMPLYIAAGETREGFVHTNQDHGMKYTSLVLYNPGHTKTFEFLVEVPGLQADYTQVEFDKVVPPHSRRAVDREGLRKALEDYACCVLGPDGKTPGDPLNIAIVGPGEGKLFHSLVRRGWDVTETVTGSTVMSTIWSSLFGLKYRNSPVSALYLDGRKQDIALQKARGSVDERNHLRLWFTPIDYQGAEVWIGQISRDIGVRLSSKTITTHKIDPDVDETRDYLLQDLLLSGSLAGIGYVNGVGAATPQDPRYNYTLDPYFTDGLRLVLFISDDYVSPDNLEMVWPR
jgi:hypothetical protein